MWKKASVPHLGFFPGMCLEGVEETNYLRVSVGIPTRHLPIISPLTLVINNNKR